MVCAPKAFEAIMPCVNTHRQSHRNALWVFVGTYCSSAAVQHNCSNPQAGKLPAQLLLPVRQRLVAYATFATSLPSVPFAASRAGLRLGNGGSRK